MKNKKLIYAVIIAIGIIGVTALVILGSTGRKTNTPAGPRTTTEVDVNIKDPVVTGDPVVTPPATEPAKPFDPSDPVGNGDIAPDEIPDKDSKIVVAGDEIKEGTPVETPESPVTEPEVIDENVTTGQKNKTEEKSPEADNEIINDREIEKREEAEKKQQEEAEKDDRPTEIVSESKTTGSEDDKPVSVISEEDKDNSDAADNGNGPAFVDPAQGGSNPFEGGGESEIDDRGSDEFVDDGGDRPGEGIHF